MVVSLESTTLLLSQGFEPLGVISWQRAICLLSLGKVDVVEEYDRAIRSMNLTIKMPAVARLRHHFRRPRHHIQFRRQYVLARDGWRCQYCGQRRAGHELTLDHVIPRSRGGARGWDNMVTCCIPCNRRKADQAPQQAGLRLKRQPARPTWFPAILVRLYAQSAPALWRDYLLQAKKTAT